MEDTQANILEVVAKELTQRQQKKRSSVRQSIEDTQANILQVISQELSKTQEASDSRESIDDTQANILAVVSKELADRQRTHNTIARVSVGNVPAEGFFDEEEDDFDIESSEAEDITRNHTVVLEPKLLEAIQETLRSPADERRAEEQESCWFDEGEEELGNQGYLESDSHFLNDDEDQYEEEDCDDTIVRLSKFIELPAWSEAFRQSLTPMRETLQRRFSEVSMENSASESSQDTLAGEETRMMLALSQDPSFREMMVKNQQELLKQAECPNGADDDEEEEEEDFSSLTVSQLRARCKQLGLSTGGKKANLVMRLEGHREAERAFAHEHTPAEDGECVYEEDTVPGQGMALQDVLQQLASASPSTLAASGVAATLRELLTRI